MERNRTSGRVTNSAGDVDLDGDLVGVLRERVGSPYFGVVYDSGRYVERPGFDERITAAGGDPDAVRRLLGVAR